MWFVFGTLILLLVLPILVGLFLPEKFRGAAAMTLAAAPAAVWEAIMDYERHPTSAGSCKGVQAAPDDAAGEGLPAWTEDLGPTRLTVQTVAARAPERLVLHIRDSVVPITADWTITIAASNSGSRVALTNATTIKRGTWHVPLFKFMMGPVGGVRKGVVHYLRTLATSLGEKPAIEPDAGTDQ